jgi:hypothetical protein
MSALSAIETPVVAGPESHGTARAQVGPHPRPLRAVAGPAPAMQPGAPGGAAGTAQPRFSSISAASSRSVAGPRPDQRAAVGSATASAPVEVVGVVVPARAACARVASTRSVHPVRLRLTTRGRVVVAALVLGGVTVAVLLMTLLASGGAQATNHGRARAGFQGLHTVVVQPGQTLWSIAAAAEPTADPRTVVQEIMSANALTGATITAGQLLWVPR